MKSPTTFCLTRLQVSSWVKRTTIEWSHLETFGRRFWILLCLKDWLMWSRETMSWRRSSLHLMQLWCNKTHNSCKYSQKRFKMKMRLNYSTSSSNAAQLNSQTSLNSSVCKLSNEWKQKKKLSWRKQEKKNLRINKKRKKQELGWEWKKSKKATWNL